MAVEKASVLAALKVVRDPDLQRDIVSLGFIKDLSIDDGRVAFTIELTTPACPVKDQLRDQARAAVMQVAGVSSVDVRMSARVREAVNALQAGRELGFVHVGGKVMLQAADARLSQIAREAQPPIARRFSDENPPNVRRGKPLVERKRRISRPAPRREDSSE